jgi:hypothetical protein
MQVEELRRLTELEKEMFKDLAEANFETATVCPLGCGAAPQHPAPWRQSRPDREPQALASAGARLSRLQTARQDFQSQVCATALAGGRPEAASSQEVTAYTAHITSHCIDELVSLPTTKEMNSNCIHVSDPAESCHCYYHPFRQESSST